jgi:hypothetical protein
LHIHRLPTPPPDSLHDIGPQATAPNTKKRKREDNPNDQEPTPNIAPSGSQRTHHADMRPNAGSVNDPRRRWGNATTRSSTVTTEKELEASGSKRVKLTASPAPETAVPEKDASSLAANTAKKHHDSFSGDEDYVLVSGDPANGIVVIYPQLHMFDADLDTETSEKLEKEILTSQIGIYSDCKKKKTEHLYVEGMTQNSVNEADDLKLGTLPSVIKKMEDIADAIENGRELHPQQQNLFLTIGGAVLYAILSQKGDTPATLHATTTEENIKKREEIVNGKEYIEELTSEESHFLLNGADESMAQAVKRTESLRGGKPAAIIIGKHHTFDTVFSGPEAPAVYRKKSAPE